MSRRRTGRVILGAAALVVMTVIGWRVGSPSQSRGPAVVDAASTWRVISFGDGRYRWVVEDGRSPLGPSVTAEGVIQSERGDPVELALVDGIASGAHVEQGQLVAVLRSPRANEAVDALAAERDLVAAEKALLEAGGRPETVAAAQQQVAVARAALDEARQDSERLADLARQGAVGAWLAQEAALRLSVREAELSLAQAQLEESRLPPRAEEAEALSARLNAAETRLEAARSRAERQQLTAPFSGVISLPGGEVALVVRADGPRLARIALPETERSGIVAGSELSFAPTANPGQAVGGHVLSVGDAARPLGGRTVVWVVGELDDPAPIGATGIATVNRSAR